MSVLVNAAGISGIGAAFGRPLGRMGTAEGGCVSTGGPLLATKWAGSSGSERANKDPFLLSYPSGDERRWRVAERRAA